MKTNKRWEIIFTEKRRWQRIEIYEVYDETKTRVPCYMPAATNEWIRVALRNENQKEQISLKKEANEAMRKVEVTVSFDEGSVIIGEESYTEWKGAWKKDLD